MAGFDFDVECRASERVFLRALLRRAQSMARDRGIEFRYRWDGDQYYVTVDGLLMRMEALILQLADAIPPYAEALPNGFTRRRCRAIARRLVTAYVGGVDKIRAGLGELEELMEGLGGSVAPGSYQLDVGGATHLKGQVTALSRSLIAYHNGKLAPAELVEILHTTINHLLLATPGSGAKSGSFEERVRAAAETGVISDNAVGSLVALNAMRRRTKHKGQRVRHEALEGNLSAIISACHQLAAAIRRGA